MAKCNFQYHHSELRSLLVKLLKSCSDVLRLQDSQGSQSGACGPAVAPGNILPPFSVLRYVMFRHSSGERDYETKLSQFEQKQLFFFTTTLKTINHKNDNDKPPTSSKETICTSQKFFYMMDFSPLRSLKVMLTP